MGHQLYLLVTNNLKVLTGFSEKRMNFFVRVQSTQKRPIEKLSMLGVFISFKMRLGDTKELKLKRRSFERKNAEGSLKKGQIFRSLCAGTATNQETPPTKAEKEIFLRNYRLKPFF